MPRVHLVTYATDPEKASHLPDTIKNLATTTEWTGFLDKIRAVHAFAQRVNPADLIVFTDAYDAAVTSFDPDELTRRFEAFGVDILFSAETNCFPFPQRALDYTYDPETPFIYLNSGGYMATASALRALFETHPYETAPCDQGYFTDVYLQKPSTPSMALDTSCTIFQTMYRVPWTCVELEHGELVNTYTKTRPLFIHFNGRHDILQNGSSIIPTLQNAMNERRTCPLAELGTPLAPLPESLTNPMRSVIVECARRAAARFVPPHPDAIATRDRDNQHAFFLHDKKWTSTSPLECEPHSPYAMRFHVEIRSLVFAYLKHIGAGSGLLDILLHDYVGIQHNTPQYPHSVLGFSKDRADAINICIPDRYAIADYRGMLDVRDPVPLESKRNQLLFIGSSTGKLDPALNTRLRVCEFAASRPYINAWISEVVNLDPRDVLSEYIHAPMTIPEQHTYRHLLVVDGNTACWDRLPWILASGSVCWKLESTHECWYYDLLKPWVHYVPCTLETLDEVWKKVSGDVALQKTIVANANAFARSVLTHEGHALYTHTLLTHMETRC
jgi:hypothetical protein